MLLTLFIVLLSSFSILFLYFFRRKKRIVHDSQEVHFILKDIVKNQNFDPKTDDLTPSSKKMIDAKVLDIYLMHGTFVGDDPFDLVSILTKVLPRKFHFIESKLKSYLKRGQDFIAKDLGNFSREHCHLILSMSSAKIKPHLVHWSSGNHHMARFRGCLTLLEKLESAQGKRVLLIGHSHAGQIFALLTRFISRPDEFKLMLQRLQYSSDEIKFYLQKIKFIKTLNIDIVTLGAPSRYQWFPVEKIRILHIINHRGKQLIGGDFASAVFTRSGDYVQQWGIEGSDIQPPSRLEQEKNQILNEYIGLSTDISHLKERLKLKRRLHNTGVHLLVDYGDDALYPNFFRTILGHACYTKIKHFKLLLRLIVQYLY